MDINTFVNATSRAWSIPILAHLHAGIAGRQAPLLAASGASRSAFTQSIDHLISMGLLERNPGYGHPLRPEFRLTNIGVSAARIAHKIHNVTPAHDQDLLRRSWTLPVLSVLHHPSHFGDIKRRLPKLTDRALSQSLKAMETRHWVQRTVDAFARPPRSIYHAATIGKLISHVTAQEIVGHTQT